MGSSASSATSQTSPLAPGASTPHFRTCNLCEAMCGLRIDVAEGRIVSIRGDEDDPLSRGHICPKAVALQDLHHDPDRLRQPVKRTASGWERISWEQAFDETARRLHELQAQYGRHAVAAYVGNPAVHNTGLLLFGPMLLRTLKTRNRFSATSVDQLPHMLASYLMLGHQLLIPIPDIDRTSYLLVLGANPLASNGSLMTAPDIRRKLQAIKERGKLVVLDPRRTETARLASEHIFIRPGTDALFLAALVHTLLAEIGPTLGRLAGFTDGLDALRQAVQPFGAERVAAHTGVDAATIRRLARELATAESAVCYGRVGTSTQAFGGLCQWLINAINIITGNFDRPGGAMFPRPAIDLLTLPKGIGLSRGSFGRWHSRVRKLPEFGGELPVAALAEDILTEGPGQIRALLTVAGNPVLSTPNGKQLDTALGKLDFMVAIDPYINETTRHAHIILPPVSPLERGHYDLIFHLFAVRNTAKYAPPLFAPGPDTRQDWQILSELQHRLETLRHGRTVRGTLAHKVLARLGPEGLLDLGLRMGPYGVRTAGLKNGLSLRKLKDQPHGVDLGPLEPSLPGRLGHPSKRIDLAPAPLVADLARLEAAFPSGNSASNVQNGELLLIGRRHLRDNNSWMHNLPSLMSGKPRCTLLVHPDDAAQLGLSDGSQALVRSRVGQVTVAVRVTDEIMPGVVSLPHGYGHGRAGVQLAVAAQHAGASINDLTDDQAVDALAGTAAFSGVPVHVTAAAHQ